MHTGTVVLLTPTSASRELGSEVLGFPQTSPVERFEGDPPERANVLVVDGDVTNGALEQALVGEVLLGEPECLATTDHLAPLFLQEDGRDLERESVEIGLGHRLRSGLGGGLHGRVLCGSNVMGPG